MNQKITVIEPDPDKGKYFLDWVVREYIGAEIYPYDENVKYSDIDSLETIKHKNGISIGDEIFAPTFFGWVKATVCGNSKDMWAEADNFIFTLEFSKDDRQCWVSSGHINKACLDKVKFE